MSKTNSGLLAYAKAQVGLPYWYGTYGQTATESLYTSKQKQYPSYYTAEDFASQYGKRVHDCVGLIKGYLWSDSNTAAPKYTASQDTNAKGMYSKATTKGEIDTLPATAGVLVFKTSNKAASGINHVGVYDGEKYVYEAKGHAYGVVKTTYKAADWQFWAQCPYTEDDTTKVVEVVKEESYPTIRSGNKGDYVKKAQEYLNQWGASITVDGVFGSKTLTAVKSFQRLRSLTVDGIVGPKTWAAFTEEVKPYTVTVTATALNVRKGPGTNYGVNKTIRNKGGKYVIVAQSIGTGSTKGWGKLKTGEGWFSLDHVK